MSPGEPVPLPPPFIEAFGRPTWREVRAIDEARLVAAKPPALVDGQGAAVVIAPGFGGSTGSMGTLADWLAAANWDVTVADLDRNARDSTRAARAIIAELERRGGATLIGHSRGGQQARVVAMRRPELVDRLITLGAPIRSHTPRHFALRATVETLRVVGRTGLLGAYDHADDMAYEADLFAPFAVDVDWTTIWSKSDGFVAWQACVDPAATAMEVNCSHRGLVASVASFRAIADVLANSCPHSTTSASR